MQEARRATGAMMWIAGRGQAGATGEDSLLLVSVVVAAAGTGTEHASGYWISRDEILVIRMAAGVVVVLGGPPLM